jgi:hypothetical protein
MNVSEISSLLDNVLVGQTDFEFEFFNIETSPTSARQLVSAMEEIECLTARSLMLNEELTTSTNPGHLIMLKRELRVIKQKLAQLNDWYAGIDPSMREEILGCFETEESEYWASRLGRQAAIEILTIGKTTPETMDKMTALPEETFENAVRICVRYAGMIKEVTAKVETSLGLIEGANVPTR